VSGAGSPALPGLRIPSVSEWILGLPGLHARPPLRFTRVGQGQSNLTFLVTDAAGGRWILRRPPLGVLLASAHDVAREHRILRALQDTTVPTPAICSFTEDPQITDVPLLLMTYVGGLVVDDVAVAERLAPAVRLRIGHALVRTLARVHDVDLHATGLVDLASHKPYAARQLKRWRRQWEDSHTRELPAVLELADTLEAAMPPQRELMLVHGDFHLLNVIADPGDGSIRAVLDWELCTLGDPLADLGGLMAYWPQASDAAGGFLGVSRLEGFPSRRELADTYASATGRDTSALPFWHALGLWKIAIICEGVRARALADERNAATGGIPGREVVDWLIAQACMVADEAGL
jgi:aminoglycoside phosphotransferase (APT) family kinase protein